MKPISITLFLSFFTLIPIIYSQEDEKYVPETDPLVLEKLEKWQDLKFGLLMHWGTYSQWGLSNRGRSVPRMKAGAEGVIRIMFSTKKIMKTFRQHLIRCSLILSRWAKAAKDAGMKYVVFTTKHHDGFSMFDTKLTDYRITSDKTPFHSNPKANVTKEIFNAFRAEGLWAGAYFSKPDWHNENYWWPNFATPDRNVNYDIDKIS